MNNLNHFRMLAARLFAAGMFLADAMNALAEVRYVDVNSANPTPPYTNWTTAATNIQDAVDAAFAGDEIVVTNGIYAIGWRLTLNNGAPNRVAVDKPLAVRSVNGPKATTIDGGGSVRCAYLTNGASLLGFTLTNGWAAYSGIELFTNAGGGGLWCESATAVVSNCVIVSNTAYSWSETGNAYDVHGGGAYGGTLNNCTLVGNEATTDSFEHGDPFGGGAYGSTLNNCTLTDNSTHALFGQSAEAAIYCTLNNCALTRNGASLSMLNNCTVTGSPDAGALSCTLNNCSLTGNSWGGAFDCTLNNCVAYFNHGTNYDSLSILNNWFFRDCNG